MRPGLPQDPPFLASLEWPGDVRELAGSGAPWPWFVAAAGALLVGGMWWWRRRTTRDALPVAAAAAPADRGLAGLRALVVPADAAAAVVFCQELKALLRLHCRERFGLRAEVATSEELVRALPAAPPLQQCLAVTDHVLFAAATTSPGQLRASHAAALAFAEAGA